MASNGTGQRCEMSRCSFPGLEVKMDDHLGQGRHVFVIGHAFKKLARFFFQSKSPRVGLFWILSWRDCTLNWSVELNCVDQKSRSGAHWKMTEKSKISGRPPPLVAPIFQNPLYLCEPSQDWIFWIELWTGPFELNWTLNCPGWTLNDVGLNFELYQPCKSRSLQYSKPPIFYMNIGGPFLFLSSTFCGIVGTSKNFFSVSDFTLPLLQQKKCQKTWIFHEKAVLFVFIAPFGQGAHCGHFRPLWAQHFCAL